MAYDARSGGVYILINGDASPLERKLEQVRQKISLTAKNIEGEFQGIFSRFDISDLAQKSLRSMATIQTSVRALGTDMSKHQREWEKYAKEIGLADNQAKKFAQTINSSLQAKSIKDIEQSLRNLQRQTGMTNAEVMKLAQEMGAAGVAAKKAFSELGIRSSDQIKRQITDIKAAFDQLKSSGTASAQDIARAQTAMQTKIAALNQELKGTSGLFGSLKTGAAGFVTSIGAGTASVAALITGFIALQKSAIESYMALERVQVAYANIFGGKDAAASQLEVIREQTRAVGQQFMETAESAKTFFAAGQGSSLAPEMNKIFKAISDSGAALQLTQNDLNGVFLAFGQMISKGKVQAEELRGQIGERLPGAFQMAAQAMNMSTAELDKFMADGKLTAEDLLPKLSEVLENKFSEAAKNAANTLSGSLNKMYSEWEQFKANIAASGPAQMVVNLVTRFLEGENEAYARIESRKRAIDYMKQTGSYREKESIDYTPSGEEVKSMVMANTEEEIRSVEQMLKGIDKLKNNIMQTASTYNKMQEDVVHNRRKLVDGALKDSDQKRREDLQSQRNALEKAQAAYENQQKRLLESGKITQEKYNELIASSQKETQAAIDETDKKLNKIDEKGKKSGKSAAAAATRAANAQSTYNTTLENTQSHIESLQQQLKLDKTESVTAKKIAVTEKYAEQLRKVTNEIDKQVRSGSITSTQGDELKALKEKELSLERDVKLRELENKAVEENLSHLQEQLSFYDELAQMSGNYTTSMELQNQIIDIQAQKYRDLKTIPEELIQEWAKWKKLEASTNPFDGALRGLKKFAAEYGNSAKQWENITYNFAKGFEQNIHDMFDEFIDTGKISFDNMAQLFKNLLKQMAYQALVQPIVLSVVNGIAGAVYGGTTTANGAASGVAGIGGNGLTQMAGGMAQSYAMGKIGGSILDGVGNWFNSAAASLFPETFAATASQVAGIQASAASAGVSNLAAQQALQEVAMSGAAAPGVSNVAMNSGIAAASHMPTQTATQMLSNGWTMGAGLAGSLLGNYVLVPALGIKGGLGTSIGSTAGGALGGLGGAIAGATLIGGSFGGPIGAGLGALAGTVLGALGGSLFGGGYEDEPGYYINTYTDLTKKEGLAGYKEGTAIQNHRWDSFSDSTASAMRDKVARPLMTQLRENTVALHEQIVALGGKDLGESFFDAIRKNQGSGDKRTGKGGIELSDYFHVHGEWHETNSPDVEKWAEQIGEQYQKVIVKSIANMDMKPIAVAADGMVADTEEEIAIALAKAGSLISVGDAIEDEKLKESFEKGISKSLVAALKSIDTKNLGLTIDKSSLAGWQTAIQAMAAWTEVNTTIDNMLEPASEISVQFKSIGNQFETWKNSLEALGWQSKKINEIDKKRIEYVKKYADETMNGFEKQDEYIKLVKEINEAFADVYQGMQDNGISQSDLNNVNSRRDAVLREYMDGILEPFRETDDLKKNIQSISDAFVSAIAAMKEASDTFSEAEIDNANKLRDEAIRKTISEALAQYDAAGTSSSTLKGIASDFTRVITAMKNAASLYTADDISNAQAKMTATMRKYVSSVTDAYKTTNNLQRQTDEINITFDDLIEGMREADMAVKDITAAERQRAQALDRLRDETLNGYDQDLSLRITALNTGSTDSYSYQLLAQAYQQENERSEYEKNIGINNEQYNRLLLVQQAETLNTKIKLLQAQLRNSLQAELDNSTEMLNVATSIKSTFSSILRSLKKARQSLWTSDKNLATDRYEEAYRQFNELYARAMKGDEEALKELSSIGDTVLSLGKEQLTSRTEYNAAFYDISRKLKDAEGVASSHLDIAEKDVETQTKISDSLKNQINAVTGGTESLSATIGDLESMIQAYQKQLQSLLGIINTSIESSTRTLKDAILGLNDGTSTSRNAILETKAALMNYGEALAKGQKAGNWTSESVLKEIEKNGLTFDQWYTKYGVNEFTEAAKRTGTVVKSIEDLQKITGAYDKLLEAKAKQLNDTMYSTSKVAAGGWTADLVRQEIASRGMTVKEWYEKYGKSEGYLLNTSDNTKSTSVNTNDMIKALNDYNNTQSDKILEVKAALLNMGETLGKGQSGSGWTAESVAKAIKDSGMTMSSWLSSYGGTEFANAAKKYGYTDIEKFMNDVLAGKVGTTSTSSAASTTSNSASTSSATKTNTSSSSSAANNNTNTTSSAVKTNTNSSSSTVATTVSTKNTLNEKLSDLTAAQKTILENKSKAMQNGFLLGSGQTAGSQWTQQKVLDTIHATKKTMQQWIDATWNKTEKSVWDTLQKKSTTSTKYKTDLDLLIAKAAAMNKAKQSGKTNWNAKTAYDEIHKIMKKSTAQASLSAWYTQSGKKEGFKHGGITPRNEAFWVGEEGPELVMSPQSYGVLSNQDSIDLMRTRLMAPSVEDDSLIRETNNILRQALRKIDQLEYDSHKMRQYIQKWDNDGLPATAAY